MGNTPSPTWYDRLYKSDRDLWLAVDTMLLLMAKSGLPMSRERVRDFDLEEPEIIGLYVVDIKSAGITVLDIQTDMHEARRRLRFFPSSGALTDLLSQIKERRAPRGVISDPVYVQRGDYLAICSRQSAVAAGAKFWADDRTAAIELGWRNPVKELPEGMAGSEYLRKTLVTLETKMTSEPIALPPPTEPVITPAQQKATEAELKEAVARVDRRKQGNATAAELDEIQRRKRKLAG